MLIFLVYIYIYNKKYIKKRNIHKRLDNQENTSSLKIMHGHNFLTIFLIKKIALMHVEQVEQAVKQR